MASRNFSEKVGVALLIVIRRFVAMNACRDHGMTIAVLALMLGIEFG
jgi:hypothetical protein